MHQRRGKKILIYFFLLFLVGSINNIEFNNLKFEAIKNINVLGLGQKDNKILFNDIKTLCLMTMKKEDLTHLLLVVVPLANILI